MPVYTWKYNDQYLRLGKAVDSNKVDAEPGLILFPIRISGKDVVGTAIIFVETYYYLMKVYFFRLSLCTSIINICV